MKTPGVSEFHCLHCGSVVEQDPRRLPPFCCGVEMTRCGERVIPHDDEVFVPLPVAHRWVKTVGSQAAKHEQSARAEFATKQPF